MLTEILRRAFLGRPFSPKQAAEALGIQSPYSTLSRLKSAGILERKSRGLYAFTPLTAPLRISPYLQEQAITRSRLTRSHDLGQLARKRWLEWLENGYVKRIAPRRYRVDIARTRGGGLIVRRN